MPQLSRVADKTPVTQGQRGRMRAGYVGLVAAFVVVGMKLLGYLLTGSVAILSDAGESVTNIVAALSVILSLRYAARPADYEHPYGHSKIEYLSSAFEGALILGAAGFIGYTAVTRLFDPQAVAQLSGGSALVVGSSLLNGLTAYYLRRVAKRTRSVALEANAKHLMTDVYTSAGVLAAVFLIWATGWLILDPLIALYVAYRIVREGLEVMARSAGELLDARLPDEEEALIMEVLKAHPEVLGYHRLHSRRAGFNRFAEIDIFVRPEMSVKQAHDVVKALEDELCIRLEPIRMTIHIEPYEAGKRDAATSPSEEFERAL